MCARLSIGRFEIYQLKQLLQQFPPYNGKQPDTGLFSVIRSALWPAVEREYRFFPFPDERQELHELRALHRLEPDRVKAPFWTHAYHDAADAFPVVFKANPHPGPRRDGKAAGLREPERTAVFGDVPGSAGAQRPSRWIRAARCPPVLSSAFVS